jgi:hypothetical protein
MEIELEPYFAYFDSERNQTQRLDPGMVRKQLRNLLEAAGPQAALNLLDAMRSGRINGRLAVRNNECGCILVHLFAISTLENGIETYRHFGKRPVAEPNRNYFDRHMLQLEKFIDNVRPPMTPDDSPELAWIEAETQAWLGGTNGN